MCIRDRYSDVKRVHRPTWNSVNTLVYEFYLAETFFRDKRQYTIEKRKNYYTHIKHTSNFNLYTYTYIKWIDVLVKVTLQYLHNVFHKGINNLIETVNVFTVTNFVPHFDGSLQRS